MPVIQLEIDANGAIRSLNKFDSAVGNSSKKVKSSFDDMKSAATAFIAGIAVAAIVSKMTQITQSVLGLASAMNETQAIFDTAFSAMSADADQWAQVLQASYQMSELAAKGFLNQFQLVLTGMGLFPKVAGEMSNALVKVGADLAAAFDREQEAVMNDIRSALSGSMEAMDKYGVVIRSAQVEQEAMRLGLAETTKELTQADKAMATYSLILEKTTTISGTAKKEAEGYAGQLRELRAMVTDTATDMGKKLMPAVTKLIKEFIAWNKRTDALAKSFLYTVKVIHFVHNAILGLIAIVTGLATAWGKALKFMYDKIRVLFTPLELLAKALKSMGLIENNPFEVLGDSIDRFDEKAAEVFDNVMDYGSTSERVFGEITAAIEEAIEARAKEKEAVKESVSQLKEEAIPTAEELIKKHGEIEAVTETTTEKTKEATEALAEQTKAMDSVTSSAGSMAAAITNAAVAQDRIATAGRIVPESSRLFSPSTGSSKSTSSGSFNVAGGNQEAFSNLSQFEKDQLFNLGMSGGDTSFLASQLYKQQENQTNTDQFFADHFGGGNQESEPQSDGGIGVNITNNFNESISRSDVVDITEEQSRMEKRA